MTCSHRFKTTSPHRVLKSIYAAQMKANPLPIHESEFVRLKSRAIIQKSNLRISDTAIYSILTKLTFENLISVHSNPDHKQGYSYSITTQGMHCYKCKHYQEGLEPAPAGFVCGPVEVICDF